LRNLLIRRMANSSHPEHPPDETPQQADSGKVQFQTPAGCRDRPARRRLND
jgi:hypothetical protein